MLRNQAFVYISLILTLSLIIGCAIRNDVEEEYTFVWDMSVENHTGLSNDLYSKDGKHRGMSVFHWRDSKEEALNQLIKNNIEWVAMVPFMYQPTDTTKVMHPRKEVGVWNRRDSAYIRVVKEVHKRNVHVMLKPHLWMDKGWRSNIKMDSSKEWDVWFDSYEKHMLHYAALAEHLNIELLCIGTEFRSSIKAQPKRWNQLIGDIKNIYKGKLTYAANWDGEYENVKFWSQMDYIGIQAYFPLTNKNNPDLAEIKEGWDKHIKMLKKLSKQYDRPILFSEIGYRSDASATIEPWVWGSALDTLTNTKSNTTQNLAYEALFQKLWNEDWFAGMYFWQWHNTSKEGDQYEEMEFTPRYKPAENTMAKWYSKTVADKAN